MHTYNAHIYAHSICKHHNTMHANVHGAHINAHTQLYTPPVHLDIDPRTAFGCSEKSIVIFSTVILCFFFSMFTFFLQPQDCIGWLFRKLVNAMDFFSGYVREREHITGGGNVRDTLCVYGCLFCVCVHMYAGWVDNAVCNTATDTVWLIDAVFITLWDIVWYFCCKPICSCVLCVVCMHAAVPVPGCVCMCVCVCVCVFVSVCVCSIPPKETYAGAPMHARTYFARTQHIQTHTSTHNAYRFYFCMDILVIFMFFFKF